MLRTDSLKTIQSAVARGEAVHATYDAVRAIEREARQLRAQAMRDAFRSGFAWLSRSRDIGLPAGKAGAARSL